VGTIATEKGRAVQQKQQWNPLPLSPSCQGPRNVQQTVRFQINSLGFEAFMNEVFLGDKACQNGVST
jgi:hypothetical protein